MEYENKINSFSFPGKKANMKNKKDLRIKLTKIANNYFKPRCEHFLNNIRSLNFRILESSGGKKSIDKEAKFSRNFRFGKTKDYFVHFMDLSPYKIEMSPFVSNLKKAFTKEEINVIKKNKDYYIQNEFLKDNVALFNDNSLYQVLNIEEKEEQEKKTVKVFHNLNYYDNRRKSVIFNPNNSNISANNSLNKSNKSDKKEKNNQQFYQTSLNNNKNKRIEEKNKITYNLDNLSHFQVKKNKLDIIEREIRKRVKKMKKEDEKLSLINERKKNLINEMVSESENEIKKIVGDKNYYSVGNYDMINEMNIFKKRKKNLKNISESSFPIISVKNSRNFLSTNIKIPKKNISEIKDPNYKRQISLYKRDKLKEIKKKNEENEQLILRDIHRKIKSIYDSFKYK